MGNMKLRLFFTILFFLINLSISANDVFYDLFSNEELTFIGKIRTIPKLKFHKNVYIQYLNFTGIRDTNVQTEINKAIESIAFKQLDSDSFNIKLFNSMRESLSVYYKLNPNKYKSDVNINDIQEISQQIKDLQVDTEIISYFNSIVCIGFNYNYYCNIKNKNSAPDTNFSYYEVYYFNIKTGEIFSQDDVFTPSFEENLNNFIKEFIIDNTRKKNNAFPLEKEPINFSFIKQGVFFPTSFSFGFYIPSYKYITLLNDGQRMYFHIALNEIQKYLNPNGPYGFLMSFPFTTKTNLKNLNNPYLTESDYNINDYNPIENYIENYLPIDVRKVDSIKIKRKIKQITLYHIIVNNKTDTVKFKSKAIKYDNNGNIKGVYYYSNNGRIKSKKLYYFDEINLIRINYYQPRLIYRDPYWFPNRLSYIEEFKYDNNNNLLEKKKTDIKDNTNVQYHKYYYSKDSYWEEAYACLFDYSPRSICIKYNLNEQGLINSVLFIRGSFLEDSITSHFNSNRKILSITNKKLNNSYLSYDENENLISYKNNQTNYIYIYDFNSNLTQAYSKKNYNVKYNKKNDPILIEEKFNDKSYIYILEYNYK